MYQEGALYLTFSGVPSSVSRLSSPGEKEGKKAQGRKRKNETQASNCQICDNAKFHCCYPGYSGNHFTRLRRHLGLKSEIFIKPLTSRFAKAVALCLNFSVLRWLLEHRPAALELPTPSWISSGTARHHPRRHFLGTRVAQGPARSPQCPWAAPAARTGAAPTSTRLLPTPHSWVTGLPVTHWLCAHRSFTVRCFPRSSLASPAPELEFAIWLQPGAQHHDPSSPLGPGCRIFFPCSFQHKKKHFLSHPAGGKPRSRTRILLSFGGPFSFFFQEDKGWHAELGFSPQVLLHEMDVLEKRQSTAGELAPEEAVELLFG